MADDAKSGKKRIDPSSFKGKYPYVRVLYESEAGHLMVMDDTPGEERYFFAHKSGTYTEISSDGKMVNFSVGDIQNYGKSGTTITIDENGDTKISGHQRIIVGGGSHVEVAGDAGVFVGGDAAIATVGNVALEADHIYAGSRGNFSMNVGGNFDVKVKGTTTMESGGETVIKGSMIHLNPK